MLNHLNKVSVAVYVKALLLAQNLGAELRELKEDQRGLSGIVVAVMLILIAVLAAILFWEKLSGFLETMWENITNKANGLGS